MTNNRLSVKNIVGMGFMVFSMFLGAGNIIFPLEIGYLTGNHLNVAIVGFLISGVGLPLWSIVISCRLGGGFNALTQDIPKWLISTIGVSIFLLLGPLYGIPRTAIVAYNIGIVPFLDPANQHLLISQVLFGVVYFVLVAWLGFHPGELLEKLGNLLTPIFLVLIGIIIITPLILPLGSIAVLSPLAPYKQSIFIQSVLRGYSTLDALAALMFGIIVMTNLKSHGISAPKAVLKYSALTGIQAAIGMTTVYIGLFYVGAQSRFILPNADNGATIMAAYVTHQFGWLGNFLLSFVVLLACITTAIGVAVAFCEYMLSLNKKIPYRPLLIILCIVCVFTSTQNLSYLIQFFSPILLVLYPIAISLLMINTVKIPLGRFIDFKKISRLTLITTFLFSSIDSAHKVIPELFNNHYGYYFTLIPGYEYHMIWIIPTILVLSIATLITILSNKISFQKP